MNSASNQDAIKFYWEMIKPYKWLYVLIFQASIVTSVFPILYNYSLKLLIDLFTNSSQINFNNGFLPIFLFILAEISMEISWRVHNLASWHSLPHIFQRIMNKVTSHIFYLPYSFFQNNQSGSIISMVKGINDGFYHINSSLESGVTIPLFTTIFAGVSLAFINFKIFLIVLVYLFIKIPVAIHCYSKLNKLEEDFEEDWHNIFGKVGDNITNIFTMFFFTKRKYEIDNLWTHYEKIHKPKLFKWHQYDFWMSCVLMLITWTFVIFLLFYIIHLKNSEIISTGDIAFSLTTSYLFISKIWESINTIKKFNNAFVRFRVSLGIMNVQKDIIDDTNAIEYKIKNGNIEFKNVNFSYDNNNKIFENFNLSIKKGEKIGLVGYSGAGKSTLISLLLKNFKIHSGEILVNDFNIYQMTSDSLRSQISFIPQDIMLFHRSIFENIAYGSNNRNAAAYDNAYDEEKFRKEVLLAAKKANIDAFIQGLPEKYRTLVGERGVKLSGGQKQRIRIARAILKAAPIMILDEATSSLDSKTENLIQHSIQEILRDNKTTVIAIAHRLSTIRNMDRIIVMDNGKIVEDGPFEELIKIKDGKFKEIWDHQFNNMIEE